MKEYKQVDLDATHLVRFSSKGWEVLEQVAASNNTTVKFDAWKLKSKVVINEVEYHKVTIKDFIKIFPYSLWKKGNILPISEFYAQIKVNKPGLLELSDEKDDIGTYNDRREFVNMEGERLLKISERFAVHIPFIDEHDIAIFSATLDSAYTFAKKLPIYSQLLSLVGRFTVGGDAAVKTEFNVYLCRYLKMLLGKPLNGEPFNKPNIK